MVKPARRRRVSQMTLIRNALQNAGVPEFRYSLRKPVDNRICITHDQQGYHVFIPDRGVRTGERVFRDWHSAICDAAGSFELKYTERIIESADEIKRKLFHGKSEPRKYYAATSRRMKRTDER